jgi:transcriptional regulator with XRE-family HTH domain
MTAPNSEIAQRFGANLACVRQRAGISQEELGFRASLHRTEVGQLERGVRMPRIDTLEISCGELLDGMGWAPGGTRVGRFTPGRES